MGMARSRFDFLFWRNVFRSLVLYMMIVAATKSVHSSAMFVGLVMLMLIPNSGSPYFWVVRGQRSMSFPPMMKSPIRECDARARK